MTYAATRAYHLDRCTVARDAYRAARRTWWEGRNGCGPRNRAALVRAALLERSWFKHRLGCAIDSRWRETWRLPPA
jgi:hypothetical protein